MMDGYVYVMVVRRMLSAVLQGGHENQIEEYEDIVRELISGTT
jgi:hypothetical protein